MCVRVCVRERACVELRTKRLGWACVGAEEEGAAVRHIRRSLRYAGLPESQRMAPAALYPTMEVLPCTRAPCQHVDGIDCVLLRASGVWEKGRQPYTAPASSISCLLPLPTWRTPFLRPTSSSENCRPERRRVADASTSWRVSLWHGIASAKKTMGAMCPRPAVFLGCISCLLQQSSHGQALRHVACRVTCCSDAQDT